MSDTIVEVRDLWKSFNDQPVLTGINLSLIRGESLVVIGQSGCGKSVLLKHLICLMTPDKGSVIFDGEDLADRSSRELIQIRRRIGILFQSAALFDSLTVSENVGLGLRQSRAMKESEIARAVMEKLDLVGLADAADKRTSELSGGMRKRVGLARAIVSEPQLLLYDEPTTGLDPITADMINDLIVDLNQKLDVTSVAVTHDMISAYKIADRVIMLYAGKIQFDGTPDELRATSDPTVRQFITGSAQGPIKVR